MERYVISRAVYLETKHVDDASGFKGYYKSIPSALIAARMTYLCE